MKIGEIVETLELTALLRPLLRWWWLLVLAAAIAAISSAAYTLTQPSVYVSRSTLIVGSTIKDPNPDSSQIWLTQMLAQAYADIAQREPLRQATMNALNLGFLPDYTVYVIPNTQIVELQVYAQDPTLAHDVAAQIAQQIILQGPTQQAHQGFVEDQLARLEASIVQTQDEIVNKQQELANLFSAREIANTQDLLRALDDKLTSLQGNYASLLATTQQGAANAISVLEPANLPMAPMGTNVLTTILVAAFVALALAAGGAYLIEFLDDSIKEEGEVQELLKTPLLATVPKLVGNTEFDRLIMLQPAPHPAAESYRLMRTNLQFAAVDRKLQLLLITSPTPNDGKSTTAANLAAAYARTGKKVILVDADLHKPSQQRFFQLINNIGLTLALLNEGIALESLLQATSLPNLHLLTTGPLPPNPAELLGSKQMQEIFARLKTLADIVIVDSPPLVSVTDSLILATQTDGVLLVVKAGGTRRSMAKRGIALLRQVQAPLLGITVNSGRNHDSYSYHYPGYGYYNVGWHQQKMPSANQTNGRHMSSWPLPNVRNKHVNASTTPNHLMPKEDLLLEEIRFREK